MFSFTGGSGKAVAQELEDPIAFLESLVLVNSGTRNVLGVQVIQSRMDHELQRLGFTTLRVEAKSVADLLVARWGHGQTHVVVVAHADTVFETSLGFSHFQVEGEWASGPGVIDNKGGLVVLREALKRYIPSADPKSLRLTVLISPAEETGNPLELVAEIRKWGDGANFVLGFEPAYDDGSIIEARRGNRWFEVQVSGKEAHSGRSGRNGINAAWALSVFIAEVMKLNLKRGGPTVSVGFISGGQQKFNIVCGEASAKLDARFTTLQQRRQFEKHLQQSILKAKATCARYQGGNSSDFQIAVADDLAPFSRTAKSVKWIQEYTEILNRLEGQPRESVMSLGSSDLNIFGDFRKSVLIDGLGPYGSGMHTVLERLYIPSLMTRSRALCEFLEKISAAGA